MNESGRVIGIFTSPGETFESLNRKPTWIVPFVIVVLFGLIFGYLSADIGFKDRIALMEAQGRSSEEIEKTQSFMSGSLKYLGVIILPVGVLISWSILAGVMLIGCNSFMGGEAKFKKVFSIVAWSYLIMELGGILKSFLILSKGTTHGVTTSLAILVPLPELGEKSSLIFRFLSRLDLFTVWQLVLWIIGLSVVYRLPKEKSATFVLSLWGLYIVVTVLLGGLIPFYGR